MKTNFSIILLLIMSTSNLLIAQDKPVQQAAQDGNLKTYVIERDLKGAGALTQAELKAISQGSCKVIKEIGSDIKWLHSYVTQDKIFCVYQAVDEEILIKHAEMGGFPINAVHVLANTIDPTTAEE